MFSQRLLKAANLSKIEVSRLVTQGTIFSKHIGLAKRIAIESDGGSAKGASPRSNQAGVERSTTSATVQA